jgi:hypothetical protein
MIRINRSDSLSDLLVAFLGNTLLNLRKEQLCK